MLPWLGTASHHFPDASEQPERRVMSILREREDELAVEVVVDVAPRIPALPLIGIVGEGVDRIRLTVEHREVKLAFERVEV